MKKIITLLITFLLFSWVFNQVNASINFTVSPTKYEIEALKWTTITKTATLYNYSKTNYTITTWKADFTTNWTTWTPIIVNKSDLKFPDQQLSSWINIETLSFIIAPWEKKKINFIINIPKNATPGGHYWAVFFKKQASKSNNNTSEIWVNINYWILLMVNVDWKVIMKWAPKKISIITAGWWGSSYSSRLMRSANWNISKNKVSALSIKKDNCPLYDFTASNFDWKCLYWNINTKPELKSAANKPEQSFNTYINIPFKNEWNTHIKPVWKIRLIDANWNELKWIGQKIIKNKRGAVIWEKIVDYLPINDVWWNVLPYSTRDFKLNWKWFSYKTYDKKWNEIIKYWTPWEYFTKKNIEARQFIMFWERYSEKIKHEKITALIDLSYKDRKWKNIEFNSAKEFYVDYKESYIWYNPYVIILMVLVLLIVIIIYTIKSINKIACRKCEKRINKNLKACPYCWKKVKSKK